MIKGRWNGRHITEQCDLLIT